MKKTRVIFKQKKYMLSCRRLLFMIIIVIIFNNHFSWLTFFYLSQMCVKMFINKRLRKHALF